MVPGPAGDRPGRAPPAKLARPMPDAPAHPPASATTASKGRIDIVAGVLAVVLPGLGHLYLGQKKRAAYAAIGILGLFFGGLFIGGIDTVDAREDRWWFVGQALVGPIALGTNWVHQNHFKLYDLPQPGAGPTPTGLSVYADELPFRYRSAYPGEMRVLSGVTVVDRNSGIRSEATLPVARPASEGAGPPNTRSIAKVNEIGTLYGLCAGMLNLIVILDALIPTRAPGHDQRLAAARLVARREGSGANEEPAK